MKINWKGIVLWNNHFYGICAVLLSMEAARIIKHILPDPLVLLLIYLSTVVYYTHAYLQEYKTGESNERVQWYQKNYGYLNARQFIFTCICIYIAIVNLKMLKLLLNATAFERVLLLLTGILSLTYYTPLLKYLPFRSYRSKGVFKSLAISWVWSITCCFIPIWFSHQPSGSLWTPLFTFHFVQLFLFVLVLAILFDIKDLHKDEQAAVYTIALSLGARQTVKKIIAPLLIVYYLIVMYGVFCMGMPPVILLLQGLLSILTYFIALAILTQKAIYLNLLLIDGLLVIKALMGIALSALTNPSSPFK